MGGVADAYLTFAVGYVRVCWGMHTIITVNRFLFIKPVRSHASDVGHRQTIRVIVSNATENHGH